MRLIFFNQPAAEALLKALCWTFVHSLWQAVVVAILGGIVITITQKRRALYRYNLFLTLFVLLLVAIGVTFINELSHHSYTEGTSLSGMVPGNILNTISTASLNNSESAQTVITSFVVFLNRHASVIILCWFLLFVAKFLQLSYGVAYIGRLRKTAVVPAAGWAVLVHTLSKRIGLKKAPQLMESSRVTIPMTFGFLRATILVPLSLLSNLPLNQVEAVLLHELAHIRRGDYGVNLFQNGAELIFFFNPALLWLSSLIRHEREACCDDIVLQHTAQKGVYFEALVSFQEYSLTHSSSALAMSSSKSYLYQRMQRMLSKKNQNLNNMEKTFLILGVLAISAFGFVDTASEPRQSVQIIAKAPLVGRESSHLNKSAVIPYEVILPQSLREQEQVASSTTTSNDTVPKPKTKTTRYSNVTTKSSEDGNTKIYEVEATDSEGKTIRLKKLNDEMTELEVDGKKLQSASEDLKEELAKFEKLESNAKHDELFELQRKEHEKLKKVMEVQKKEFAKHHEEMKKHHKALSEVQMGKIDEIKKIQQERAHMQKEMAMQNRNMVESRIQAVENVKRYEGNNNEINSIINDLMKRGVITGSEVLTFSLSSKEFTVNGRKGPADLHQALKEKYIKKEGDSFSYSKSGGSTTTTINKE